MQDYLIQHAKFKPYRDLLNYCNICYRLGSVTIDYGPFGFLDEYNPNFIPNHSDDMGRYDFEKQVFIIPLRTGITLVP